MYDTLVSQPFEANWASHMTQSHHAKHPMNVFCHFFGLGVRLRTILLYFLALRETFPGGSYIEVRPTEFLGQGAINNLYNILNIGLIKFIRDQMQLCFTATCCAVIRYVSCVCLPSFSLFSVMKHLLAAFISQLRALHRGGW